MRLSIFTTVTEPLIRQDLVIPALECYNDLADEIVVVDGSPNMDWYAGTDVTWNRRVGKEWPKEFYWPFIGEQFQTGYEIATGDWVIHADLDFIFHERDFQAIRKACERYPDTPALSFWKYQFILPDRYIIKSRITLAVNKKVFGDRIRFDSGGDLCQPSLDGEYLDPGTIVEARVPVYNYEKIIKTKEQIAEDQGRMERAWQRHFGKYQMGSDGTDASAYNVWHEAQRGKFDKPQEHIALNDHPKYMKNVIKSLKPEHFGYNGFGMIEGRVYESSMR